MKTIEVDPFDIKSVNAAIKALEAYEVERKRKITMYMQRLCEVGAAAAQKAYGSLVTVTVTPDGRGMIAHGDQVIFLEFGSGVLTKDHELSGPLPIEIMPGSWSEGPEGKHTWSQWLESGRRFTDYPYNTNPRAGMWEAYKAIVAAQERIANEVFSK